MGRETEMKNLALYPFLELNSYLYLDSVNNNSFSMHTSIDAQYQ